MKAVIRIWAIIAMTGMCYGECDIFLHDSYSVDRTGQLASSDDAERAKNWIENKPSDIDHDGNWGQPTNGLQLSIRLPKTNYTNGEPIKAMVIFRNVTNEPISFPKIFSGQYPALEVRSANNEIVESEAWKNFHGSPSMKKALQLVGKYGKGRNTEINPCRQRMEFTTLTATYHFSPGDYSVRLYQEVGDPYHPSMAYSALARFTVEESTNPKQLEGSQGAQPPIENNVSDVGNALVISIRLPKTQFTDGEPIIATTIVSNKSNTKIEFTPQRQQILFIDSNGRKLHSPGYHEPQNEFERIPTGFRSGSSWSVPLLPGEDWTNSSRLDKRFQIPGPGKYRIKITQSLGAEQSIESPFAEFEITPPVTDKK